MRLERLNWREAEAYFKTHDLVLLSLDQYPLDPTC